MTKEILFLDSQLDTLEAQQGATARGGWEGAENILGKAAQIIAILKGLFETLPKGKITFWWVLGNAGEIASAILALISVIAAQAVKALDAKAFTVALDNEIAALTAEKADAPADVAKWLEVVIQVALLIVDFINTTDFRGKIDLFFILRHAGKISKLIQDIFAAVKG
jgi:hypothetical protein